MKRVFLYSGYRKSARKLYWAEPRRVLVIVPPPVLPTGVRTTPPPEPLPPAVLLRGEVDELLQTIGHTLRRPMPQVELAIDTSPVSHCPLNRILSGSQDSWSIRLIIDQASIPAGSALPNLSDHGISHLVQAEISEEAHGWYRSGGVASVLVKTDHPRLRHLVVDVILDIALFYSLPKARALYGGSIKNRIACSQEKAAFARKEGLTSFYGPIHDPGIGYFSFASAARTGASWGPINTQTLDDIWQHFLAAAAGGKALAGKYHPNQRFLPHHKRIGQISPSRLDKAISRLQPGQYFFVLLERVPRRLFHRRRLSSFFGSMKLHANLFRIVPESMKKDLLAYGKVVGDFISVYPFEKTEEETQHPRMELVAKLIPMENDGS